MRAIGVAGSTRQATGPQPVPRQLAIEPDQGPSNNNNFANLTFPPFNFFLVFSLNGAPTEER